MESQAEREVKKLKDNPIALRKIIIDYLEGKKVPYDPPLFALSTALRHVPGDDAFFIDVVKRLDDLSEQNPEGYSYRGILAHDKSDLFITRLNGHYTPENIADFQSRIERMNQKKRRGFLDSKYAGLIMAVKNAREKWTPLEQGIHEFHGHAEVIVQLDSPFVEKLAEVLDKYGFTSHAAKLRDYESYQTQQAQKRVALRLKSLAHWHGKASAMDRIHDQSFLKQAVSKVPPDFEFGYQSPQAIAVKRITDLDYLRKVANTYKDSFIAEAAQKALKNFQ